MPNTSSAKKALRVSDRKHLINLKRKKDLKQAVKQSKKAIEEKDEKKAKEMLEFLYKTSDKIAKTGYIKKNKASRIKSRITKLFNKKFENKKNQLFSINSKTISSGSSNPDFIFISENAKSFINFLLFEAFDRYGITPLYEEV